MTARDKLSIGITCHPGFGGSGVVASEIGLAMADRGHRVHFVCTGNPPRLGPNTPNATVHLAQAASYPALQAPAYSLALASKLIEVARTHDLDLIHSHYAVPHATTAWMARQVIGPRLKTVSTVHGTDVSPLGGQPSYAAVTRHAIQQSDAVTAPSTYLGLAARRQFDLARPIEVIPNFVCGTVFRPVAPADDDPLAEAFGKTDGPPTLVHISSFRAIKRPEIVVETFARVVKQTPARLLMIGDGPERAAVEAAIARLGLQSIARIVGHRPNVESLLRRCSVFLLPSRSESFGLAALEALACGVPVVASNVGGLPEVIRHGKTGFLVDPDDLDAMAARVTRLLRDPAALRQMAIAARADALARFCPEPLVDRYEALYQRLSRG